MSTTALGGAACLVTPLLGDLAGIRQRALVAIRESEPAYAFGDPEAEAEWADGVADMLSLVFSAMSEGRRRLAPTEAQAVRATGRRRAEQGIELRSMLRSVRVARDVVMDAVYGVASRLGDRLRLDQLAEVDRLLHGFAGDIQDHLQEGWTERTGELAAGREQARERAGGAVLSGAFATDSEAERALAEAGCDPTVPRCFAAVPRTGGAADFAAEITSAESSAIMAPRASSPTPHIAVLLPAPDAGAWQKVARTLAPLAEKWSVTVLLGEPWHTPTQLHEEYAACSPLVAWLPQLAGCRPLVRTRDLLVPQLVLSCTATARRVAERSVLGPVLGRPEPERTDLMTCLVALVRHDFNVKSAARELGRNVKTVYDKRKELERLLTVHLGKPDTAPQVAFAVHSYELGNGFPFSAREPESSTSDTGL